MSHQPDSDAGRVFIGSARVSTRGQDLGQRIAHARQLIHEEKKPVAEAARLLKVHCGTL